MHWMHLRLFGYFETRIKKCTKRCMNIYNYIYKVPMYTRLYFCIIVA